MFKCHDCHTVFDEPKCSGQYHPYGEGYALERYSVCPRCGGSFSEAFACKYCGEYFCSEELHNSYCIDCLKDNFSDTDDLFEFAKSITTDNNINEFVLYVFKSIEKTNDVLKLLLKSIDDLNPKILEDKKNKFIEEYADDLAEFLEEQKNE